MRRVQSWYYGRSRKVNNKITKSYSVTWRVVNLFAITCVIACGFCIFYIIIGYISDGGVIFSISQSAFKTFILMPVIAFWGLVVLSFNGIHMCCFVLRSESDDKIEQKYAEFDGSLDELGEAKDVVFSPGDVCPAQARYRIIEGNTKKRKGELLLAAGERFPKVGDSPIEYVRLN